jgi:hypothetical protein
VNLKEINSWFKRATQDDFKTTEEKIVLTCLQKLLLELRYKRRMPIESIIDFLQYDHSPAQHHSRSKIEKELKTIRDKVASVVAAGKRIDII